MKGVPITCPEESPDRAVLIKVALEGVPVFLSKDLIPSNLAGDIEFGLTQEISTFHDSVDLITLLASDVHGAFRPKDLAFGVSHPLPSNVVSLAPCRGHGKRRQNESTHEKQQE